MNTENKGNQSVINTKDKTNHIGLWVSLSVAATAAIGVLVIAFYMDYQENKTKISEPTTTAISTSSAPSAIPTSEAQAASIAAATSDRQVQGMTAPSDDGGNNDSDKNSASSTINNTATASQTTTASQAIMVDKQTASDPAKTILGTENAINAESQVVAPSNTTVNFYFAVGKADLAANTLESLKDLVAGVKNGKKAVILSHADAEANATLTKERAFAVRSVLLAAGVPENSIEVKEPTTGKSNSRLVQVILQ